VELTGDDGLLTAMIRQVLQTGLEVELTDHLGYEPHDPAARGSGNSRNGSSPKKVTTDVGEVALRFRGTGTARSIRRRSRNINGGWMVCRGM
jgi:transposase-like protein